METLKKGKFNADYKAPSREELEQKHQFLTTSLADIMKYMSHMYTLFGHVQKGMIDLNESMDNIVITMPDELVKDLKLLLQRTEETSKLASKLEGLGKNAIDPAKITSIGDHVVSLEKQLKLQFVELEQKLIKLSNHVKSPTETKVNVEPTKLEEKLAGMEQRLMNVVKENTRAPPKELLSKPSEVTSSDKLHLDQIGKDLMVIKELLPAIDRKVIDLGKDINKSTIGLSDSIGELIRDKLHEHGTTITSQLLLTSTTITAEFERRLQLNNKLLLAEIDHLLTDRLVDNRRPPTEIELIAEVESVRVAAPTVIEEKPEEFITEPPLITEQPAIVHEKSETVVTESPMIEEKREEEPEVNEEKEILETGRVEVTLDVGRPKKVPSKKPTRYTKKH